ncbi:peptidase S41 [Neptunitalea chrysea]|uniref:Peptidase S41 n=1 Tax=Neptunitalea chrysea TaxID=1647581 RepID=A0A9W6B7P5_9FLAO|nr:S41 family peptidase [Neptunitalea chrysea]GLB53115.1 peptidase S41 [Neptunitalea chrysea]
MKGRSYLIPIFVALALSAGIVIGSKMRFSDSADLFFTSNSKKDKLNRLIDYIDYEYVDDVNTDSIVDVTVNNILAKLDPHSVYIPNTQTEKIAENMKGEFVGVGISVMMLNDTLMVTRTLEDTPAERGGILAGDRILMADKDTLYGQGYSRGFVISKLKGVEGVEVNLKIYRKSTDKVLDIALNRAPVPLKSVDAFFMVNDEVGYIKVNRFAETTYKEFRTALTLLRHNGAKAIAIDLRDNPGGYMEMAEQMADEFLPKGRLIVFTRNKRGEEDKIFATDRGDFESGKVYVLINENSASASEIVAGALQDNDVGTIVGRRSFGKGLVQREMPLPDGSAVRLTIARYYTPTGRSIQKSYSNGIEDYYDDFQKRYERGELQYADSIQVADSLRFTTPKGKVVYGGGGIIPDVFVPLETIYKGHLNYILQSELVPTYVFEYLDTDRGRFASMTEDDFIKRFHPEEDMLNGFQEFLNKKEFGLNISSYDKEVSKALKAAMANQLFGDNAYQRVLKSNDTMVLKVLELYHNTKITE